MWKKRNFQLTDEQLKVIERAMHHDKHPEVRQKAHAIYLLHLGEKTAHVARKMAVSRTVLYKWHDAWLANGINGLARKKGSGRRRKASPEYEQLLEQTLETDPSEHGYDFTVWTVDRLREHLYEATGNTSYLKEAQWILDFLENRLMRDGFLMHHWEAGKLLGDEGTWRGAGTDGFCIGCNFQTAYVLWWMDGLVAGP